VRVVQVMAMIEKMEREYEELGEKMATIENDKKKIEVRPGRLMSVSCSGEWASAHEAPLFDVNTLRRA
jgi:predicted patatin/cPLA2 family phospholipase